MCSCISPMASQILFFKASIVSGLSNGVKSQLRSGQNTSALRLIMRSSKTGRKSLSVASAVWHVAASCWNQMLSISSSSIFVKMAQLCLCLPNNDPFWVRRLFNVYVRVFYVPNATILLVYIPAKIKMNFIWKDDFSAKTLPWFSK